jgi:glutaredoxin-related protein
MLITQVTDKLRALAFGALSSTAGENVRPVRVVRSFLATANDLVGRPLAPAEELAARRAAAAPPAPAAASKSAAAPAREAAPVVVYFDGRDHRTKRKIEELLKGRDIPFRVLDVANDEATRSWCVTQAKLDEFPLVFVAGEPIGGLHELTQADVNGLLAKKVFG